MTSDDDVQPPNALAPDHWDEFVGQANLKRELEVKIQGAIQDRRPLGHILLCTVPGAGKTTLARLIADRLGDDLHYEIAPIPERVFARILRSHSGILVIDEVHRYSKRGARGQETLLPLIGPERTYRLASGATIECKYLSVVAATTEPDQIIKPLWDRFANSGGGIPVWDEYTDDELALIVAGMARRLGVNLNEETCRMFGIASVGIPRMAEQYVLTHRDLLIAHRNAGLPEPTGEDTLALIRTSSNGLTAHHERYLETLEMLGGTKGLKPIASVLRMPERVVEDLELLLLKQGYIELTDRGRDLTPKGYAHRKGGVSPMRRGSAS